MRLRRRGRQPRAGRDEEAALAALHESLKVHEGEEGWLFLAGGPNRPLQSYGGSLAWWWALHRWAHRVRSRARRCRQAGIRFAQIVVPEKLSMLGRTAPGLSIDLNRAPVRVLARRLVACGAYLDLVPHLDARIDGPDLYLKTDSHWTDEGCGLAYAALCAHLGATPINLAGYPVDASLFVGDLGLKLEPPRSEIRLQYRLGRDATRFAVSPLVQAHEAHPGRFTLHRGAHVGFRNERAGADPRRLVLFGDSFAGYEAAHLTGMLAETFREVHFVWSSSLDWGLIETLQPDILVAEIAERFLFRTVDDSFDLAAYGRTRLAT